MSETTRAGGVSSYTSSLPVDGTPWTLSRAWVSAEASLPLDWQLSGLYRFEDLWIGLAEGPEFDD